MEKLKLKLWEEIDKAIENGIDTFYFGACYGFDLSILDFIKYAMAFFFLKPQNYEWRSANE